MKTIMSILFLKTLQNLNLNGIKIFIRNYLPKAENYALDLN